MPNYLHVEDAKRENLLVLSCCLWLILVYWPFLACGAGVFGENLAAAVGGKQLGFVFIAYLILSLF